MSKWLIFTDLDGTLLDSSTYSFDLALPALKKIKLAGVPLIISSSKTYSEIKDLRREMHNNWAFSVENGAAVFFPQGNVEGYDNTMQQIILGVPIASILKVIHDLREQQGFLFKGFSDYSVEALMLETGLKESQAIHAKQRLASEPIKWLDSEENLLVFEQALNKEGLQLIQGGRFLHVMGENDKSLAMAWIVSKFKEENEQDVQTIALGDSQNDYKMLENADFSGVIRRNDRSHLQLNKDPEKTLYSQNVAPLGWQEVIDQFFDRLNIGESNE